jgi:hypothetical protein
MYRHLTGKWKTTQKLFLTSSDATKLRKLLKGDSEEMVRYCNEEQDQSSKPLPFPDDGSGCSISCLDLHAKVILECWHEYLGHPDLLAYDDFISRLQERLTQGMFGAIYQAEQGRTTVGHVRCMFLLNTMTKMLLQSVPKISDGCFDSDWLNTLRYDPSSDNLPVYNQFTKHFMMLMSYGYKHIHFDLLKKQNTTCLLEFPKDAKYVCGVARVIVSMLPHDTYEVYRQDVRKRQQNLVKELSKDSPNEDRIVRLKKSIENAHDVSTPRPLQHLCRLSLYNFKAGKKLLKIVSRLELPEDLKHMLTLGVYWKHFQQMIE